MTKTELKNDLKKVCKNWFKIGGYKIFIKDIKDVIRTGSDYSGGIDHKVTYTVELKNGTAYDIIIETRDAAGVYNVYSGKFELVNIINFIW